MALDFKIAELRGNGFVPHYSRDIKHSCKGMRVAIPFLRVRTKREFELFSKIMLSVEMSKFDSRKMALLWVAHVDGVNVFPKEPAQLREYHKKWERNGIERCCVVTKVSN